MLAKQYPLTLPPWFALIIRTFSALEGLGLSLDDKYRSDRRRERQSPASHVSVMSDNEHMVLDTPPPAHVLLSVAGSAS